MTAPDPRHVDALAAVAEAHRLVGVSAYDTACACGGWTEGDHLAHVMAAILTTTDPAALDAMEDALVRAGRLTRQDEEAPLSLHHRLVTDWREVQP